MIDDLIAFLRARLDWDERDLAPLRQWAEFGTDQTQGRLTHMQGTTALVSARRALAEVEAKRRILDLHQPVDGYDPNGPVCSICGEQGNPGDEDAVVRWPCATVRLLALPYADHPDYREEWRPSAE